MRNIIKIIALLLFIVSCDETISNEESFDQIEVELKMEVQILDSTYQLYSRPFTKIYFSTYKLSKEKERIDFQQSDTTSCPNGWGVKELNFTITNPKEKIVLGASNENYNGLNYREIIIEYDEILRRTDTPNHANMVKTFAIYYQ
ncbi:MAG: hypothetical protein OQJ81_10995 [Melioribacteraceae bacterium]|nr:hypothetical protein [Melioribacteraceae bacterium]